MPGYSTEDNFRKRYGQEYHYQGWCCYAKHIKKARRATQDIALDFIRYSISDDSIKRFIEKLNCLEDLKISIDGDIT